MPAKKVASKAQKAQKVAKKEPMIAYMDNEFLESEAGRQVRMLSEFIAPGERFEQEGIKNTIVMFGSARTLPPDEIKKRKKTAKGAELKRLNALSNVAEYYNATRELAAKLGKWANTRREGYAIMTGGGPGIMEAGNRGASDVGTPTAGLNIKLPFEQHPNPYITDELNMQFRYFFIRKFWFLKMVRALVAFPGGYGTLDELFETLTLIQTHKQGGNLPVVIFGKKFWDKLINWDYLVETGMINKEDLDLFLYTDSVDEAFEYITKAIEAQSDAKKPAPKHAFGKV